jgi:hypothetical protein
MSYVVKKGTTSRLLAFAARNASDDRSAKTGLSHETPGASAAFVREGEAEVRRVSLVGGRLGEFRPGGFVEVDPDLMPGVYQFGLPDDVLAPGSESALLILRFPGTVIDPIEIALVAYDPQDEDRLGMSAIGPEGRIAALRGAFPRLTARELADDGEAADPS